MSTSMWSRLGCGICPSGAPAKNCCSRTSSRDQSVGLSSIRATGWRPPTQQPSLAASVSLFDQQPTAAGEAVVVLLSPCFGARVTFMPCMDRKDLARFAADADSYVPQADP